MNGYIQCNWYGRYDVRTDKGGDSLLNIDNPIPLHIQLKNTIKQEVRTGKYVEKIPSERELMERFQISRSTVREAINHLVHEQVLEKVHGKGTFIRNQGAVHEMLDSLHSFSETVRNMGMEPSAKLLYAKAVNEPENVCELLGRQEVFTIARLRMADKLPIAIERHFYTKELGSQLEQFDLHAATIYELLEDELQIALVEAQQTIKCEPILADDAKLLGLEPKSNILCVERIITGQYGEIIEVYKSIFHPEYYELKLKTARKQKY